MRPEKKWAAAVGQDHREGALGALFGWRRQNAATGHKQADDALKELSGHDAARVWFSARQML